MAVRSPHCPLPLSLTLPLSLSMSLSPSFSLSLSRSLALSSPLSQLTSGEVAPVGRKCLPRRGLVLFKLKVVYRYFPMEGNTVGT